jgi:PIN domain nuclease of toxin-antitoxin system
VRLLLDTHAFLFWVSGGERLSPRARSAIALAANECHLSLASCWEIAIKVSLGKLRIDEPMERFIPSQMTQNGFRSVPIELRHVLRVARLPFLHRDPFDRLLAAQALEESLTIVSADTVFPDYGVDRIW